uniref:Mitochondrial carrier protein n=1 Tax=Entomoneis paludosa TaxID=265537 RepID=A0A6U3AY07_9STRA|mmetsp:Transcript_26069/g.54388  ORF Transcript_26069/g.54388 Transcript_26069/m.54388 type:complete len:301 (+) Transcript_26069:118-1020(+)
MGDSSRENVSVKGGDPALAPPSFLSSLVAGGMAGMCVDVALFPIDTIKTRLQAPGGFWKAGGFRNIYHGLGAVALGSAPGAALFFSTYEQSKGVLAGWEVMGNNDSLVHMTAASMGEFMACLVRVPTEVTKARMQTSQVKVGMVETVSAILREPLTGSSSKPAGIAGLYRGFTITLMREIPFSMIQFPLYEKGKRWCSEQFNNGQGCSPLAAAACGSLSGAIAGAATTPLDVLKTRHMLGSDGDYRYKSLGDVLKRTLREEGVRGLFHGLQPRVFWISLGGFVFFGAYEGSLRLVKPVFQ